MTDETEPVDLERQRFRSAVADVLGYCYPGTDRELALAAIAGLCAKTPPGSEDFDRALRQFTIAISPLAAAHSPAAAMRAPSPSMLRAAKRSALESALSAGTALIVVDTKHEGVQVPDHLRGQRDLRLRLGWQLKPQIYLSLQDEMLSCVLSFSGREHPVIVAWDAIWAVVSEATGSALSWPASTPEGMSLDKKPAAPAKEPTRERPKLALIEGGRDLRDPEDVVKPEALAEFENKPPSWQTAWLWRCDQGERDHFTVCGPFESLEELRAHMAECRRPMPDPWPGPRAA